ncbi:unnamed protein product [Pichia kudriavzevii]
MSQSTRQSARNKQKQAYVVPVQKEYVAKYVHNNHPDNANGESQGGVFDFSREELRNYRLKYLNTDNILTPDTHTFQGVLLGGSTNRIAHETATVAREREGRAQGESGVYGTRTEGDLQSAVREHAGESLTVRESDVLVNFVYKVRREQEEGAGKFRVRFNH